MIEPKILYRKLDSLLSKIGKQKNSKQFVFDIVEEIEKTFGSDLKLSNGRIYEKYDSEYKLIKHRGEIEKYKLSIPADLHSIVELEKSSTYIYDSPSLTFDSYLIKDINYTIPAAIYVTTADYSWIFVFDLSSGWVREEIELCLNAVRTILNYRFASEDATSSLKEAVIIQQSLLPASVPVFSNYEIAWHSIPAELVGGDLYDYYLPDKDTLGICIGDASGHGIPAALLVRDVITGLRMGFEQQMHMINLFKKLNNVIYKSVYSSRFISLFYCEIEKNGNILYVNAGHPSPILLNKNNTTELQSTGILIGAVPELEIKKGFAFIKPDDVLILYTDGIIERTNRKKIEFGVENIINVAKNNIDKPVKEILNQIFFTAEKHGENKKWKDDSSIIIIKRIS